MKQRASRAGLPARAPARRKPFPSIIAVALLSKPPNPVPHLPRSFRWVSGFSRADSYPPQCIVPFVEHPYTPYSVLTRDGTSVAQERGRWAQYSGGLIRAEGKPFRNVLDDSLYAGVRLIPVTQRSQDHLQSNLPSAIPKGSILMEPA